MDGDERPETGGAGRSTLGDVSHTNPYTGAVFGDTQTYDRGNTVAADGGRPDTVPDSSSTLADSSSTLADVPHTPPRAADGVQRAYDRGVDDE